jgi:FkbM family methyltransferase
MIAFCLVSSDHGPMLVNRFDYQNTFDGGFFGVGAQILENRCYDPREVHVLTDLLKVRRKYHGDGVVAIDCGANIGVHSVEWSRLMRKWGHVVAIEAQERIFYALAGNITLQNCLNARAIWGAVGSDCGTICFPEPRYTEPSSFGSFELKQRLGTEDIGQPIDYSSPTLTVRQLTLDSLQLDRCDLIKLDVEGMEEEALAGAEGTINRCKPILYVETVKSDKDSIIGTLEGWGYKVIPHGMNVIAIHTTDETLSHVSVEREPVSESHISPR